MSNLTLPFMLHPRYSGTWHPGQASKPAGPQQYPYSETETMSTDEDTAEFLQYRKYKYGWSNQSSMDLLKEMSKAQVNDEPWPKKSWVLGGEVRQVYRQQEQVEEVRGLRAFSDGYPKGTRSKVVVNNTKNTTTGPTTASPSSRRPTHQPEPQVGRMLGLGGTTRLGPPQTRPQGQTRTTPPTIRMTRAQELRAQAVRNEVTTTTTRGQTTTPSRYQPSGPQSPTSRRGTQDSNRPGSSARSHSNGVSTSGTPSSSPGSSTGGRSGLVEGSHDQGLGGLESRPSSANSVSAPSNVPGKSRNSNSGLKDNPDASVQVGVEIEFLVALEMKSQERPVNERYFIPLEHQNVTTIVDGLPARKHISQLLRDSGIPAVTDHDQRDEVRQAVACFKGPLDEDDEYAFWAVKCEPAGMVMGHDVDIFDYVGLEFASRKLQANAQGFNEIRSAIRILRRHVLVATSSSCGIHVHIDAATLNLEERKHFVCLYLLAEKELFSLTAPHRRGNNTWCGPVAEKTKLAEDAEGILEEAGAQNGEDGQPPSALKLATMKELILGCTSTDDLQNALSRNKLPPFHRAALNLKEVGEKSYTFEFRHFQASLDPEVIEHFIRLSAALVMSAKGLGSPERPSFDEMYEAFGQIKGWKDLLTTIGLQGAIGHWERLLWAYPDATEESPSDTSRMEEDGRPSSFLAPLE